MNCQYFLHFFVLKWPAICIDVDDEKFDQTDKDDDTLLYLMHLLEIWYMWHETTNITCLLCIKLTFFSSTDENEVRFHF